MSWIWLWPITSRIALSATAFTVSRGSLTLNWKSSGRDGSICQKTTNFTSAMFSSPVSIRLSSGTSDWTIEFNRESSRCWHEADVDGVAIGDVELVDMADRIGPIVVEAGLGLAGVAAEDEIEADLVRADRVEARQQP